MLGLGEFMRIVDVLVYLFFFGEGLFSFWVFFCVNKRNCYFDFDGDGKGVGECVGVGLGGGFDYCSFVFESLV